MASGGSDDVTDYLQGFAKLSLNKGSAKLVEIAKGKRGKPLCIPEDLFNKLYDYQKEGVRWLFGLFEQGKGGILGDDMGLGKTVQMIAYLTGMLECKHIRCVLIIAPMSVINVWSNSFKEFSPRANFATFHGEKRAREKALERIQDRGGILVTTYDLVGREGDRLGRDGYGDEFVWDYVVADEGHQLKNKSIKRSQGAHSVPTKYRIILTGTPLQNRLPELWALFDWTHFGQLLGTMRTFNANYGNAIEEGRKKCASSHARRLGNEFAESLRKIIEPYLLRRTKDEVGLNNRPSSTASLNRPISSASDGSSSPSVPRQLMPSLPRKNDLVVWLTLSKEQEDIYRRFLTTDEVKFLLDPSVKASPLTQLIILKKLCDHPRLLSENACRTLGIVFDENLGEHHVEQQQAVAPIPRTVLPAGEERQIDDLAMCIDQSIKTSFLTYMLPQLVSDGHKVLVFSMSLRMLNLIAQILKSRLGIRFLRLDGRVTKLEDRQRILEKYQTSERYPVLLLTTQVGGVGLTITAADRVFIVDPAWNPAVDSQAVDRVYRVGQKRNVVIYRLITAGTVEEKIYRRQVFKVSIFKQVAHSSNHSLPSADDPMRYFTHQDLKELFKLEDTKTSPTHQQLEQMHKHQRNSDAALDEHVEYITALPGVVGISDHDLLFTKPDDPSPTDVNTGEEEGRARQTVERAKALIEQESRQPQTGTAEVRARHAPPEKQPEPEQPSHGGLYPRGFGDAKPNARPAYPGAPIGGAASLMQLPSELPLYLQRKGLVKPGQTILTPPKLIGRGQKEKSFTLHRSFSDGEVDGSMHEADNEPDDGNNDDVIIVDGDASVPVEPEAVEENDGGSTEETESNGESMKSPSPDELSIIGNRHRTAAKRIDDDEDDDDGDDNDLVEIVHQAEAPVRGVSRDSNEVSTSKTSSSSQARRSEARHEEPVVVNLDSDQDDDVQIVEPERRRPLSSSKPAARLSTANVSSNQDSFIARPRRNRNRIIDDDDEEEEEDIDENHNDNSNRENNNKSLSDRKSTASASSSRLSANPSNVIVIGDDDVTGPHKFIRNSIVNNNRTPGFGSMAPLTSSTPAVNGGGNNLLKPAQYSFLSSISPLSSKQSESRKSSAATRFLTPNEEISRGSHGLKRSAHERSIENRNVERTANESAPIEVTNDGEQSSSETSSTDPGDESTEDYDHTAADEDDTVEETANDGDEEEGDEEEEENEDEDEVEGDDDDNSATRNDSAEPIDLTEDASDSRISLPQGDTSMAY